MELSTCIDHMVLYGALCRLLFGLSAQQSVTTSLLVSVHSGT
jgi:hypothetical protein